MFRLLLSLFCIVTVALGQTSAPIRSGPSNPVTCSASSGVGERKLFYNTTDRKFYYCSAPDTWTAITGGGGTPGGANTQVQFNDSSAFGGDAGLTFDKATDALTVGGKVTALSFDSSLGVQTVAGWKDEFGVASASTSGTIGELGWTTSNVSGTSTFSAVTPSAWPYMGIQRIATGAISGNGGALSLNAGAVNPIVSLNGVASWKAVFIVRVNATSNISVRFGFAGSANTDPSSEGIWWRFNTAAGDVKYTAETRAAGVSTSTASGVAANTSFHTFVIRSAVAGTVLFSVDGGSEISHSTNITTNSLLPFFQCVTRTASSQSCDIDYFNFSISGLAR